MKIEEGKISIKAKSRRALVEIIEREFKAGLTDFSIERNIYGEWVAYQGFSYSMTPEEEKIYHAHIEYELEQSRLDEEIN